MRKAEFWISNLIDKIMEAKKAGIDKNIIKKAQEYHQKTHILWEWWTPKILTVSITHNKQKSRLQNQ